MPKSRIDTVKIVVVDDHPMFREGVARLIAAEPGMTVVATASTALEAVQLAALHEPDVMLLDVNLAGGGIAAAKTIRISRPVIKTIMLSMSEEPNHVASALTHGAIGYLYKGIGGADLVRVIRLALTEIDDFEAAEATAVLAEEAGWRTDRSRSRPNGCRPLIELETTWLSHAANGVAPDAIAVRLGIPRQVGTGIVTAIRINRCAGMFVPDAGAATTRKPLLPNPTRN